MNICIVCNSEASLLCQRCRDPYCSRKCQQEDWPHHKLTCYPMPGLVKAKTKSTEFADTSYSKQSQCDLNASIQSLNASIQSNVTLRPPKNINLLRQGENAASADSDGENRKLFDNPFKRNSENILFNANIKNKASYPDKGTTFDKPNDNFAKSNQENSSAVIQKTAETMRVSRKPIAIEPSKVTTVVKTESISPIRNLTLENVKEVEPDVKESIPKFEPWMTPFPVEGKDFATVIVQHVDSDGTAWVMLENNATASNNLLREINKGVSSAPSPQLDDIEVNKLFRCPFEEIYYRGVVLEPVSEAGTVLMRLIDFGNRVTVPIAQLKSSIPMMRKLNAFAFPIVFEHKRETNVDDKLNIKIKTIKDDVMTVTVEGENAVTMMNDIEIVPLLAGKKIFCLDFSNIEKGYISACINDANAVEHIDSLGAKLSDYCNRQRQPYIPVHGEVWLGKFEDNQWYRVLVSKVLDSSMFEITFIDFGNVASVSSKDLRKIPKEFTHPCLMKKCYIKDFPEQLTKEYLIKMAKYFDDNPLFDVLSLEKTEKDAYVIAPKLE